VRRRRTFTHLLACDATVPGGQCTHLLERETDPLGQCPHLLERETDPLEQCTHFPPPERTEPLGHGGRQAFVPSAKEKPAGHRH
jgi:hypothetical protein